MAKHQGWASRVGWAVGARRGRRADRHRLRPAVRTLEGRRLLATFTVTNAAATGTGSLAYEVRQAALSSDSSNTINFDQTVFATHRIINLSATLALKPPANAPGGFTLPQLTIQGPSMGLTLVGAGSGPAVQVDPGLSASLSRLTITGGKGTTDGGGLNNRGSAELTDCTITGNSASNSGGGIASYGPLTLTDCTIAANTAPGAGGVFLASAATATIEASTIADNTGSGLSLTGTSIKSSNSPASATVDDTIIIGDTTTSSPAVVVGQQATISGSNNVLGAVRNSSSLSSSDNRLNVTNPLLSSLGDYGGPSATLALLPGSPAIGYGRALGGVPVDERGMPLDSPNVDVGAFQTNPLDVNSASGNEFSRPGYLDLRQAVNLADVLGGAQSIGFDATTFSQARTINLGGTELDLSGSGDDITITGPSSPLTISGGGKSRVFAVENGVTATLSGLTITDGSSTGSGGAVDNSGSIALNNCTISQSSALYSGGGLANYGTASLAGCTISGNSADKAGGGLFNVGTETLQNCTISGNSANSGGGELDYGHSDVATLTSCTISGNSAALFGGGIDAIGTTAATLTDTIVAANLGGDVAGGVSGSNNLIGTGGSGGLTNGLDGNIVGVADPFLAPLGNYGGPTQTMALLPGSPAIGAGIAVAGITTDQRGVARPAIAPDIGAFQDRGFTISVVSGDDQSTPVGQAFGAPLVVSVTSPDGDPVAGGVVTFTTGSSDGASATLGSGTATIGSDGQASTGATANDVAGTYLVIASAAGATGTDFHLTNTAVGIVGLSLTWGTSGTATLNLPATSGGSILPAGRTTDVPWLGINAFTVTLDDPAPLTSRDVMVTSAIGAGYGPVTVSGSGTSYTITLAHPIAAADRVTIAIGGAAIAGLDGVLPVLPGDVNDDGAVNAQDLVAVQQQWMGAVTATMFGDVTGDGAVTSSDYLAVRQRIGTTLPPAS